MNSYKAPAKDAFETPSEYLASLPEPQASETRAIYDFVSSLTEGHDQHMYRNIIGFGRDAEGWMRIGLCARKGHTALYTSMHVNDRYADQIGKMRSGKGCLAVKSFAKADKELLRRIITETLEAKEPATVTGA